MRNGVAVSRTLAIFAAAVTVAFTAYAYGDDQAAAQTAASAKSAYSNKLICKREQVTGSMIPKRVCKTQQQIDQEHEMQKQYADELRRGTTSASPTIPGPLPSDHAGG
jgi:hypothetical protein